VGSQDKLRGQGIGIRSGIGRTQRDGEAPQPVPIHPARESDVKIRILNDFPAPPVESMAYGLPFVMMVCFLPSWQTDSHDFQF